MGHTDQGGRPDGDQGGRPDGVQLMVNNGFAYVGHMFSKGFSVIDVRDPRNPMPVTYVATHRAIVHGDTAYAAYAGRNVCFCPCSPCFRHNDQYRPTEVAAFVPPKPTTVIDTRPGRPQVIQSCDVFVDAGGRVYANDNNGGLYILEFLK